MEEVKEIKELEYNKEYACGNFIIEKVVNEYDDYLKNRIGENGIPGAVKRAAEQTGVVPYITVRDVSGLSETRLLYGTSMYLFFDTMDLDDNGDITEECKNACETVAGIIFKVSSVVPDVQLYKDINNAFESYIERLSKINVDEE